MDIQFVSQQESLETLCFHYILNQNPKSRTMLTNSILVQLTTNTHHNFYQFFVICHKIVDESQIKDNQTQNVANKAVDKNKDVGKVKDKNQSNNRSITDKEYYKNMGGLLIQVLTKYGAIIKDIEEQQLLQIVQFCNKEAFCAVSGNQYIALAALLLQKIYHLSSPILLTIQQMLMNPKMHVGSYRQSTRQYLFTILLKILLQKNTLQLTHQYISKIIQLIQDQKDPRNISLVFQIYLHLLKNAKKQQLIKNKKKLFECLEMYYPIDFEGDTQKNNIKLDDISSFLDQCLSNQLFVDEIRGLLMVKMGAAPVSKYITTFISTRHHSVNPDAVLFWQNLLIRTAQSQYLNQTYPPNSSVTLSTLIIQILTRLMPSNSPIPISSYTTLLTWLNKIIHKQILTHQNNSQNANLIIHTLKDINRLCNKNTKIVINSYIINSFIETWKQKGQIIYKMGLLIPILEVQKQYISIDKQKIYLLILTLNQIYHTNLEIQPKLLVLKIFMLLAKQPKHGYHKIISQTNIVVHVLSTIQSGAINNSNNGNYMGDIKVMKANVDFLVEMYGNQDRVRQAIRLCTVIEVKVYGLLTLAIKNKDIYNKQLKQLLNRDSMDYEQNLKHILNTIKTFKAFPCIQIISNLPISDLTLNQADQFTYCIKEKSYQILANQIEDTKQNVLGLLNTYTLNNNLMAYLLRYVWRPYLVQPNILNSIIQKINKWQSVDGNSQYYIRTVAFYNQSLTAFGIVSKFIQSQRIESTVPYISQLHIMLPIDPDHRYTAEQCISWPTLIHYSWSKPNKNQLRTDLIQYLPTSILMSQANMILPIILKQSNISTLGKLLKNIPQDTVVDLVLPFIVKFLETVNQSVNPQQIVACNKILYQLQTRSKQETNIHKFLLKSKGRILITIEERLIQHRKRRVRQSSRTIFAIYNSLK